MATTDLSSANRDSTRASMVDVDCLAAGIGAGSVAGIIVLGGGARLAMRLVALIIGQPPDFTLPGTVSILMLGAVTGAFLGAAYAAFFPGLSRGLRWSGALYGVILSLVFVAPAFLLSREGELGLLGPWGGLMLFGPLPVLYGLVLQPLTQRLVVRRRPGRRVHIAWLLALTGALIIYLVGMFGILDAPIRSTAVTQRLLGSASQNFSALIETVRFFGLTFVLAYCGICAALFWQRAADTVALRCTILLLLLVPVLSGSVYGLNGPLAWLDFMGPSFAMALIRGLGIGIFLAMLIWLPEGRPVSRGLWGAAAVAALVTGLWQATSISRIVSEWALWVLLASTLALIVGNTIIAWRQANNYLLRRKLAWSMIGRAVTALSFVLLWAAALAVPGFGLHNATGLDAVLGVPLYWFWWLLLPLTVWLGTGSNEVSK